MMNETGDMFFSYFPVIFGIMFIGIFGFILFAIISGIKQWNHNNKQPVLDVEAKVVTKRTEVSGGSHSENHHHGSSTWYYATFEFTSGDRMEFSVSGQEFGMLVDGDKGMLKFQGTRYLGFVRNM